MDHQGSPPVQLILRAVCCCSLGVPVDYLEIKHCVCGTVSYSFPFPTAYNAQLQEALDDSLG